MKKLRAGFMFCVLLMLLLGACGTAETGETQVTPEVVTEAPEVIETPEITEAPEKEINTEEVTDDFCVDTWNVAHTFTVEELTELAGDDVTLSIDYVTASGGNDTPAIQLTDLSNGTNLKAEDIANGGKPDAESGNIVAEGGKTNISLLLVKETIERLIANGGDQNGAALAVSVNNVIVKNVSLFVLKQDRIVLDASYPEANENGTVFSAIIPAETLEQYDGAVALTLSYVKTGAPEWPWYIVNTLSGFELSPKGNTSVQVDSGTMTFVLEKEDVARAVAEGGIRFHLCEVYFTQAIIRDATPEDYYVGDYNVAYTFVPNDMKDLKGDVTFTMEYTALPGYRWTTFQLTEITDTGWLDLDRDDYVDGSKVDDYECIYVEPDESGITMVIKEDVMQSIISAGNNLAVRVVGILPVEVSLSGTGTSAASSAGNVSDVSAVTSSGQGDIVYTLDNAEVISAYKASCQPAEKGGLNLQFDGQWEMVRLRLPESVDLSECTYISVEMNTYGNNIYYDFFDEKILKDKYADGVDVQYSCYQDGTKEYIHVPVSGKTVYAIGFGAGSEVQDPETYVATVYSVTFYMLSGNKVEVPLEVVPNVTENMTLRNTYGELFGKVGTAVSLGDLESPAYLELIKSQYNSVTSGWQAKMDQVIVSNPTLISVEDAKRRGYIIPDNYKETVVPEFNFDVIDKTMKICAENGLDYRVHTLVWHQQALDWFFRTNYAYGADYVSPEVMDARLEMYIRTVMEHVCTSPYADVVYAWDVVNEYIHFDNVNYENYTAIYGPINREPEFVKLAFTVADDMLKKHGLRNQISLFYNDYNTYVSDEWGKNNTKEIISLIEFINSDGKVCDGVGMQTHLMLEHYKDWREMYKQALQAFLDAGLEVQLTEVDVYRNIPEVTEEVQAEAYVALLTDLMEIKKAGGNITGITFWGMADMGIESKPYLFEKPGRPKEAYYRVLQAYQEVKLGLTPEVTPKPTKAPEPTEAPMPTATPAPIATPTPVPTKAPNADNELTFTFDEMEMLMYHNLSYEVETDGSMKLKFDAQYGGVKFALPQGVDLADCEKVTVKMKSEYSYVAPQLCLEDVLSDPWLPEKYATFGCQGDGVRDYELYQEGSEVIWAIGFMGTENVEDFSKYEVEVYSITFHMK